MFANLGLLIAALFISTTSCASSGPTLNDLISFYCPSDRPFKCLPYGACCKGSEFCYSGMCESCFPRDVQDGALLDWCREKGQFDVSLMRNDGCRLACQDVFNSTQLVYDFAPLDGSTNSTAPPSRRMKEMDIYEHHLITVNVGLIVCLVVSLLIIIGLVYVICRLRNQRRSKGSENPVPSKKPTPVGSKQSSVDDMGSQVEELDECAKGKGNKSTDDDPYVQRRKSEPNLSSSTDDIAARDKKKARALSNLATSDSKSCVPINETPSDDTSHKPSKSHQDLVVDIELHAPDDTRHKPSTTHQDLVVDIEVHAKTEGNQHSTAEEFVGMLVEDDQDEVSVDRSSNISIRQPSLRSGAQGEEEPLLDAKL